MARTSKKGTARQLAAATLAERVWNTAVYTRLSREDGGRKGADSIDTQIELVSGYVRERPYLNLVDIYIDNGSSGADFNRPSWIRLMDDIRAGKIDCVAVKDLSRFGRNYIEACEFLEKIFPFMGVRFLSVNDGYDSQHDSSSEALIISLKNLINDHYLRDISRKILTAGKAKKERGEQMSGLAPYGYVMSACEKGRLVLDEETAPVVRQIFDWRARGVGLLDICKRLENMGIPSPRERQKIKYGVKNTDGHESSLWLPKTINRIVTSKVYLGHMEMGKTRQALCEHKPIEIVPESEWHLVLNMHEPLVDESIWKAANRLTLERRQRFYDLNANTSAHPENIFKGLLVCGSCGAKLVRRSDKWELLDGGFNYAYRFSCLHTRKHPEDQRYPSVRLERLQDVVFPLVADELQMAANLGAIIEKQSKCQDNPRTVIDAEISRAARELEKTTERLAGLYENYADKILSEQEYIRIKAEYGRKADSLRQKMDDLSKRAAIITDVSASNNRWLAAARSFQNPTELTREMLEAIVERIVVSGPDKIKITWKFRDELKLLESCAGEEAV